MKGNDEKLTKKERPQPSPIKTPSQRQPRIVAFSWCGEHGTPFGGDRTAGIDYVGQVGSTSWSKINSPIIIFADSFVLLMCFVDV